MGSVPVFTKDPYGPGSLDRATSQVDRLIGSAYEVVREVAENLEYIKHVSANLLAIYSVYENINSIKILGENIENLETLLVHIDEVIMVAENIDEVVAVGLEIEAVKALNASLAQLQVLYQNLDQLIVVADNIDPIVAAGENIDSINLIAASLGELMEIHAHLLEILSLVRDFATRAALVSWIASNPITVTGRSFFAAGYAYSSKLGSTIIPDMPGVTPMGRWSPQHFGAIGDGFANDNAALNIASAGAASSNRELFVPPGTYKISQWVLSTGLTLRTSASVLFRSDGAAVLTQIVVDIGNNVDFDTLIVSVPGVIVPDYMIRIGNEVRGNLLRLESDISAYASGILTRGQDVKIGRIEVLNIDNAVSIVEAAPGMTTGLDIGFIDITCYRRAVYVINNSGRIGGVRCSVRSQATEDAGIKPGQNGILMGGTTAFEFGDLWIENCGEHAVRIGGTNGGPLTSNVRFGNITTVRNRGCCFKINPTALVSPGVTETADNIQVGNILCVDGADGVGEGNREVLRLSHCRNVQIGDVMSVPDLYTFSGQHGLRINDARNVTIASLGGHFNGSLIDIDWKSDTDGHIPAPEGEHQFAGDVLGLRIGGLWGYPHGGPGDGNPVSVEMGPHNVGDIHIVYSGLKDWGSTFYWIDGNVSGPIRLTGWTDGVVGPIYSGVPLDDRIQVDITWKGTRYVGPAAYSHPGAAFAVSPATFTPSSTSPVGLVICNGRSPVGDGAYGGALTWTRNNSNRRAAAIVSRQGSIDEKEVGLDFFVGDVNSTANESLRFVMRMDPYGRIIYEPTMPKYADNAAALAAGLPEGTLYWDTAGRVRVVVLTLIPIIENQLTIVDGVAAPATVSGQAKIYVDTADGDLKIIFGDGIVKTIMLDS